MIDFKIDWDGVTYAQFSNFLGYSTYINDLMDDLAKAFGVEGVRFIKPEVRGNGKWQPSTGKTATGIDYDVKLTNGGFTLNFVGKNKASNGGNIANWLDVGNFPAGETRSASSYGLRAFPISARAGNVHTFLSRIHGMGHTSPEYPKHFSERAATHLHDNAPALAERALQAFLDRLVI